MAQKRKISDINLYELLGVSSTATEQEIKKAYRKKALKVHPDKNPDDPTAASQFLELSDALAILTDAKAKEAYDKTLKAKQLARERLNVLDQKRRRLREELEERERKAKEASSSGSKSGYSASNLTDEQRLQNEIRRLREEGSRILNEEQENIRQKIRLVRMEKSKQSVPPTAAPASNVQDFLDFETMMLEKLRQAADAQKRQKLKVELDQAQTSSGS